MRYEAVTHSTADQLWLPPPLAAVLCAVARRKWCSVMTGGVSWTCHAPPSLLATRRSAPTPCLSACATSTPTSCPGRHAGCRRSTRRSVWGLGMAWGNLGWEGRGGFWWYSTIVDDSSSMSHQILRSRFTIAPRECRPIIKLTMNE